MTRDEITVALAAMNGNEMRAIIDDVEKLRLERRRGAGKKRAKVWRNKHPSERSRNRYVTVTDDQNTEERNAAVTVTSRIPESLPSPPLPSLPLASPSLPSPTPPLSVVPPSGRAKANGRRLTTGDPRHKPFIDAYCQAFEESTGTAYVFVGPKEGAIVQTFLAACKADMPELEALIEFAMGRREAPFSPCQFATTIGGFTSRYNAIAAERAKVKPNGFASRSAQPDDGLTQVERYEKWTRAK